MSGTQSGGNGSGCWHSPRGCSCSAVQGGQRGAIQGGQRGTGRLRASGQQRRQCPRLRRRRQGQGRLQGQGAPPALARPSLPPASFPAGGERKKMGSHPAACAHGRPRQFGQLWPSALNNVNAKDSALFIAHSRSAICVERSLMHAQGFPGPLGRPRVPPPSPRAGLRWEREGLRGGGQEGRKGAFSEAPILHLRRPWHSRQTSHRTRFHLQERSLHAAPLSSSIVASMRHMSLQRKRRASVRDQECDHCFNMIL